MSHWFADEILVIEHGEVKSWAKAKPAEVWFFYRLDRNWGPDFHLYLLFDACVILFCTFFNIIYDYLESFGSGPAFVKYN